MKELIIALYRDNFHTGNYPFQLTDKTKRKKMLENSVDENRELLQSIADGLTEKISMCISLPPEESEEHFLEDFELYMADKGKETNEKPFVFSSLSLEKAVEELLLFQELGMEVKSDQVKQYLTLF